MAIGFLDIILIVVTLIALVWGIYRGFAGVVLGFLGTLVILALSLVAGPLIAINIAFTDSNDGLSADAEVNYGYSAIYSPIFNPINDALTNGNDELMDVVFVDNPEFDYLLVRGPFGENDEIIDVAPSTLIMSKLPFGSSEGGQVEIFDKIVTKFACPGMTFGNAIAGICTVAIFSCIFVVALFIVLFIVKIIIRRCVFKFIDKRSVLSKVDRAIGAVVMVCVIIVFAWATISLVGANAETLGLEDSFTDFMEKNPICNFFNQNNLLALFGGNTSLPDNGEEATEAVVETASVVKPCLL